MTARFTKVWLVLFAIILIFLAINIFISQRNQPGIKEVLTKNKISASVDFSMVITSLLALSLATVSVAKGYEVLKRNRNMADVVLEEENDPYHDEKMEELDFTINELQKETAELVSSSEIIKRDNEELKDQIKRTALEYVEINKMEQMLRKSNIALSKECENLKAENDKLLAGFKKPRKTRTKKRTIKRTRKV